MDKINVPEQYKTTRNILKDVLPVDLPYSISIEPSNICNFKCIMCTQGSEKYGKLGAPFLNMDMRCFNKVVSDLRQWCENTGKKIKVIRLYSTGESLLHPQIGEMVKRIKEQNVCDAIEITTNGSLLKSEYARQFVEYGLDYLRVSIYSVYKERNREITRNTISPEEIREKIKYLKDYRDSLGKAKPFIQAKMIDTYSKENEDFLMFYDGYVDECVIDQPMQSSTDDDVLANLFHERAEVIDKLVKEKQIYSGKKACRYPFTHLTIRSEGSVCVCCNDYLKKTTIGNVMEHGLQSLWNSKKLYDFRVMQIKTKGVNHPACARCEVPLRDCREDDIDDFDISRLYYEKRIFDKE